LSSFIIFRVFSTHFLSPVKGDKKKISLISANCQTAKGDVLGSISCDCQICSPNYHNNTGWGKGQWGEDLSTEQIKRCRLLQVRELN